ncbi:unnamed protein product [Kuraishia capsulata CBS 1993]|uniref:Vacuolar protein-sorting-associated protein 36 n=1 Tax=Kuraishia capsulata CBS 1993 TaxID=1382522 RepID=W6MIW1_9ASCO|nr:uncharacterized protein KUCA_T00001854001 [Kuraishia capsulata CBS 1993]CDK25883.1 unnamed protein product [Kuraishia capsulata CBS 1993]
MYYNSKYFKKAELSSSGRPVQLGETDILIQDGVGLYQGNYKLITHQDGRVYLSDKRLVYVHNSHITKPGESPNLALDLLDVDSIEYYAGFLKSSPKITLHMNKLKSHVTNVILQDVSWACPICYFANELPKAQVGKIVSAPGNASNFPKCRTCGVPAPAELILRLIETSVSKPHESHTVTGKGFQCDKCTFLNHPSMTNCEMCGHLLKEHPGVEDQGVNLQIEESTDFDEFTIKISFHKSGSKIFFDKLESAVEMAKWNKLTESDRINRGVINDEPPSVPQLGIHGLQAVTMKKNLESSNLLNDSIQDLENLMSKAKQLIGLSETYQSLLMSSRSQTSKIDDNLKILKESKTTIKILDSIITTNEISQAQKDKSKSNYLWSLRKPSVTDVNRSGYSELYIDELARQIYEFIMNENLLDRSSVVSMYELYSMYNTARGLSLVSPLELYDAVKKFETLRFNVRMFEIPLVSVNLSDLTSLSPAKKTESRNDGKMYVISRSDFSSSSTANRLLEIINTLDGVSVLGLQNHPGLSMNFMILSSMVTQLCMDGKVCVDIRLEGAFFYKNEILEFEWD